MTRIRLGIMQPYLFPYLGYFQLIQAVDKFVVYDDVAFIKQGWINRNHILLNQKKHLLSIPVNNISSYSLIKDTLVSDVPFKWNKKLLATIRQTYSKAPYFGSVFPIIETTLADCAGRSISEVAVKSIRKVLEHLSLSKEVIETSSVYCNNDYSGQDRVIDICKKENAEVYVNPIGGMTLYDKRHFSRHEIELYFLKPCFPEYKQFRGDFISGLSIIDVLMFNSPKTVNGFFDKYELI